MTTKITVLYPALAVHAFGCADAAKSLNRGHDSKSKTNVEGQSHYEAENTEAALQMVADELTAGFGGEYEWKVADLYIYPCVHKGPKVAKPLPAGRCPGSGQPFNFEKPSDRMRLYFPCPVCNRWMGTKRGVVPAHKAKSA